MFTNKYLNEYINYSRNTSTVTKFLHFQTKQTTPIYRLSSSEICQNPITSMYRGAWSFAYPNPAPGRGHMRAQASDLSELNCTVILKRSTYRRWIKLSIHFILLDLENDSCLNITHVDKSRYLP